MKHCANLTILSLLALAVFFLMACTQKSSTESSAEKDSAIENLTDSLGTIAGSYPGEIGIALLTGSGDTVLVGNYDKYPLMSVFKLHQAISLCRLSEQTGLSLDSVVEIERKCLNPDTWSPMLRDYRGDLKLPIRELMRYALVQSDNNASNYMFDNIECVEDVDSFIATVIPRETFGLAVTEAQMWEDHGLCSRNHSSPLGVAMLINSLFTDSAFCSDNFSFIRASLRECTTGADRIKAPLLNIDGVEVAHKTGSGFRDENGILAAHNDVAFVTLPDGRYYSLAVLVKDFNGTETEAAEAIAKISAAVYSSLTGDDSH